jgi:hypothetical protein
MKPNTFHNVIGYIVSAAVYLCAVAIGLAITARFCMWALGA